MKSYVVILRDTVDGVLSSTVCMNNDEVATLLVSLDTDRYAVEKVEVVSKFNPKFKEFCKTEPTLEMGKE